MIPVHLSPHLTLAEFTATQHREFLDEQGTPPALVLLNARRFALDVFEPARALVGPLHVNSGWRCPGLNAAVGGAPTSPHLEGRAADVVAVEVALREAYLTLAASAVPFDQLIWEFGRWIHMAVARHEEKPRGERLAIYTPGEYVPFDPADPRIA